MLDVAILEKKMAFIYVDSENSIRTIKNKKINYELDNLVLMKINALESMANWKIVPILYEQWILEYDSKEKREKFIQKKLTE